MDFRAQTSALDQPASASLGWLDILRLGLVQTCLGAMVVMMTSTINRVMIVELALPAIVPGLLMALHYAMQILRPVWGYRADNGGRRSFWIMCGMGLLAIGASAASVATALMASYLYAGLILAILAFILIGLGVGAAGTSLLTMLASCVLPRRRAAAATIVWVMMIMGFAITAPMAGHYLDPYTHESLILVTNLVCVIAFCLSIIAIWGIEERLLTAGAHIPSPHKASTERPPLRAALAQIWNEPNARQFTIFIFVSMLAYSAQELIIEPYAGIVFSLPPGATTKLTGMQHSGVLVGMLLVAGLASWAGIGTLATWTIGGCLASALMLIGVAGGAFSNNSYPLNAAVFGLGIANGAYAVSAIGLMMSLAGKGASSREGLRMGLWGSSQAIAFGIGGILGAGAVDIARHMLANNGHAYALVFIGEALLFVAAAGMAMRLTKQEHKSEQAPDLTHNNNPLIVETQGAR